MRSCLKRIYANLSLENAALTYVIAKSCSPSYFQRSYQFRVARVDHVVD